MNISKSDKKYLAQIFGAIILGQGVIDLITAYAPGLPAWALAAAGVAIIIVTNK